MASFFHYQNEKYDILFPTHGQSRHAGEAANAVGQKVVYLFDCSTPSVTRQGAPLTYEHEVIITPGDPLLEQEDPVWAPTVWIYKGPLAVTIVRKRDPLTGIYGTISTMSPAQEIAEAAFLEWCGRGYVHGRDLDDWFSAKARLGFR